MRRQAPMTHEQAVAVCGVLAEFAGRYPDLSELEGAWYRDLGRAALVSIAEDSALEDMRLAGAVDQALLSAGLYGRLRADLGRKAIRKLRRAGVRVSWGPGGKPLAGPLSKLSPAVRAFLGLHRNNILQALGEGVPAG